MIRFYWLAVGLSAGLIGTAAIATAEAAEPRKRQSAQVRGFVKSDVDRRPIREARPDNSSHYTYQNYPLWAARAFQPTLTR